MLAKSFAHVLPCLSLNLWHGEELFTLLFIFFSPGPPSLLAISAWVFGIVCWVFLGRIFVLWGSKGQGELQLKGSKTDLFYEASKIEDSIIVIGPHSGSHVVLQPQLETCVDCVHELAAEFLVSSFPCLDANLHFYTCFVSAVIAW
jgi:hypothetical protein